VGEHDERGEHQSAADEGDQNEAALDHCVRYRRAAPIA
jgi:hypothetical protein